MECELWHESYRLIHEKATWYDSYRIVSWDRRAILKVDEFCNPLGIMTDKRERKER